MHQRIGVGDGAVDVAGAEDRRLHVTLRANETGEAAPARRLALVGRHAEAGLDTERRTADDDVGAEIHVGARQRPVPGVADQRRAQESEIRVVAAARDAERRAIAAGTHADERRAVAETAQLLDVQLHRPDATVVGIGGTERVGVAGVAATHRAPRAFEKDTPVGSAGAEEPDLRRGAGRAVRRSADRDLGLRRHRLRNGAVVAAHASAIAEHVNERASRMAVMATARSTACRS